MCLCVGVFGFVVSMGYFVVDFVVDFLFLWLIFDFFCGSVCIRGRGVGCADGEKREKNERN